MVKKYLRRAALVLSTSALLLVGLTGTASAATTGFGGCNIATADTPAMAGYDPHPVMYFNMSSYGGTCNGAHHYVVYFIIQSSVDHDATWQNYFTQSTYRAPGSSVGTDDLAPTYPNGVHNLIWVNCKTDYRDFNWTIVYNAYGQIISQGAVASGKIFSGYQC